MNRFTRLAFNIAAIVIAVWILGLIFKLATWIITGLLYVAAVVVIIGLIAAFINKNKR